MGDWPAESATVDEREHTTHADPGWRAWNGMSPEVEFCEFAATLVRILQPRVVIETGAGQGYTTRRLLSALRDMDGRGVLLCFESDDEWRAWACPRVAINRSPTPSDDQLAVADLTILDSDPSLRMGEISRWREHAKSGAVLLVHDCGNGHADATPHAALRRHIESLGVAGAFLANPRGGFLGVQASRLYQLPGSRVVPRRASPMVGESGT